MISHEALRQAIRARLLTLSVATTGSISLSADIDADGNGVYERTGGSFLDDGFRAGMELVASGFATSGNNGAGVALEVDDLALTVTRELTAESASSGRTLAVGLPSRQSWENLEFVPEQGFPWCQEQLVPAPPRQFTIGPRELLEGTVLYDLQIHVPAGVGSEAADRYADALLEHFPPRLALSLSVGTARVDDGPGPYRKPLLNLKDGFGTVPVIVPVWHQSTNTI